MTIAFWASVALLLAGALLFVLPPLLRPATTRAGLSPMAAYRDQRAQIDAEFAQGTLTKEQHAQALEELQTRVIEEVGEVSDAKPVTQKPQSRAFVATIAALIPVGALVTYAVLGTPAALHPESEQQAAGQEGGHAMSQEQIESMVQALATKLEKNPNDANGWHMLARSYVVFQRLPEAAQAYDRAYKLNAGDPNMLADYADVLAMVNGRSLEGRPEKLVDEALKLDPQNQKALSLKGTASFNRGDFNGAAGWWKKLLATVPPGSQPAASIQANIDQALAEAARGGGKAPATMAAAAAAAPAASPADSAPANPNATVEGSVSVADAVKGSVPQGATLFVYARPADGSRMPLAILRAPADKFPLQFKLDDSLAMSPESRLSLRPQVQLVARISKSGNAVPQPGDLTGTLGPVKVGTRDVKLVISEVVK
ncbi:c-type cytochrome biogenesis protein CcmI [Ramlibacter monticola]|uniref:C-type cytochrome biogenesis protein CcmI n=1 Tax=Ramlibacter monticola TaxID=1926872 RepID=A0A936YZI0_9BURK|nr:c-type cytochrome biogenesis protein CcmI [Ramlibacter monticola]MBL0390757.1 c-type cytochrome biogenesis protein CcmI [Ramlibacter monticola]